MKQKHCMLFQPIVINHSYFIRHLKRWMICANEISIIYGGHKKACARAGQHNVFLLFLPKADEKKPNLRFVFIVFYMCRERELSCRWAQLWKKETEKSFRRWDWDIRKMLRASMLHNHYDGKVRGNLFRTPQKEKRNKFRHIYARKIKLLEFMT